MEEKDYLKHFLKPILFPHVLCALHTSHLCRVEITGTQLILKECHYGDKTYWTDDTFGNSASTAELTTPLLGL